MAARFVTSDGNTVVDHVILIHGNGRKSQSLRVRQGGFHAFDAHSVAELRARLGDELVDDLKEA